MPLTPSIKRNSRRRRLLPLWLMTVALPALALAAPAAAAEYRLDVGDVIEVAAIGVPELKARARVDLDGQISFPLLGQLHVAGETITQVRAQVAKLLPSKFFRHQSADGRSDIVVIDPDQLMIDVAEYRPIYVDGDVSKPGEEPYRPGMTALQAITLAGGYDLMHIRMENPFLQSADLESEYKNLLLDYVKHQAQVLRLQAELAGKNAFDRAPLSKAPIAPQQINQIADLENQVMQARESDYTKERAFYQSAIGQADHQLNLLSDEQQKQKREAVADTADMQRLHDLLAKGLTPVDRVTSQRRAMLASETSILQTSQQVTQVTRDRNDLVRKLQKVDEDRHLQVLKELQDAELAFAQTRSKLQAVGEKLLYTGTVRSQLVRGTGGKPSIAVSRRDGDKRVRLTATDDTPLMPGDVVEVALQAAYAPDTASNTLPGPGAVAGGTQ